ncbi:uncharacterized protein J4E79_004236 [Alternaria viburni]|uniref:uncharacterized protein n=1 Tax=Alternaria viburni TaxID=566460 RepID=UPI0020C47D96|nr:uncharacterized protein J4E79_004236 [Alternaria viburni]KAI4662925.1 hypothetical protein J4E79_004236 [Alternaria viburni]
MAPLSDYLSFYTSMAKAMFTIIFARLYKPQRPPHRDLQGQTAIVTGANSGIGLSIATALAKQGAVVYLACRNLEKGDAAVASIASQLGSEASKRLFCWKLDVGDLESVRVFCERWKEEGKKIDMLCHNAGIAGPPEGSRTKDEKGRDVVLVTNFLGSFLMTNLLEGYLGEKARVVFTSSTGHYAAAETLMRPNLEAVASKTTSDEGGVVQKLLHKTKAYLGIGTTTLQSYALSKAHQVLFAALLQRRFDSSPKNHRTAQAFSPGYVAVDTDEGAKTGAWLASCGGEEGVEGGYWEWTSRRMSLVEFVERQLGEKEWKVQCEKVWRGWEEDSGCTWVTVKT